MDDPRDYFPFYPNAFWGSIKVEQMSMEAVGLYLAMLSREWRTGSLPADATVLRRLYGGRCSAWDESFAAVRECFEERDGYLYNERLELERGIADEFSAKQSDAAKRRWELWRADQAKKHATAVPRHSQRNATAMPLPDRTGPDLTVQDQTGTERNGADRKASRAERALPDTDHARFIAWWCQAFLETTGSSYGFQEGKDGKHVQKILKRGGIEEAKKHATFLLKCAPGWIAESGVDLGTLDSQWNKLVSAGQVDIATGSKQLAVREANGTPTVVHDLYAHEKKPRLTQ